MPEDNNLIKEIHSAKEKILASTDRQEIITHINNVIRLGKDAPPKLTGPLKGSGYYLEARRRAIHYLELDLKCIEDNTYYDFQLIHFQTACSILQLLLTMTNAGVSEIDSIINSIS